VYCDERYYSAFPTVVCREGGELIATFRRAPNRRPYGTPGNSHFYTDARAVLVRSRDGGHSFEPREDTGIQGHPPQAARPEGRAVVVYYIHLDCAETARRDAVRAIFA